MPTSFFVNPAGLAIKDIPRSCIEGAEYIIQSIVTNDNKRPWTNNVSSKPYVYANFGGGVKVNISYRVNFHDKMHGFGSYNFDDLGRRLELGEGIILLNTKPTDSGTYNMHLGAIVAVSDTHYWISDVSENGKVEWCSDWVARKVRRLSQFREMGYPSEDFAIGYLHT